jgi:hypothetical protein
MFIQPGDATIDEAEWSDWLATTDRFGVRRKAQILTAQLSDMQPEGRHAEVAVDQAPYGRMLPGIRGIRLQIRHIEAKFKYDGPLSRRPIGQSACRRPALV